jgi:hypothetical protein
MLTREQRERILREAYLPEHLPDYVCAVTGAEPLCLGDFVAYLQKDLLIFIGYPLGVPFAPEALEEGLAGAVRTLRPRCVSLIAPGLPPGLGPVPPSDRYYCLDLADVTLSAKTRNMLRRAEREVTVRTGQRFLPEHGRLVESFLNRRALDGATAAIFSAIGRYVEASPEARILEARNGAGELLAFDVAEFGPRDWAFYMFNVTAAGACVPGVSDLLLGQVIGMATAAGKRFVNLGLGINAGVAAFKVKWGGVPRLPHVFHQYRPAGRGWLETLLRGLR